MDGVLVNKNVNNNKRRKKHNNCNFEIEQDENFSFIAGYTSVVLLMEIRGKK